VISIGWVAFVGFYYHDFLKTTMDPDDWLSTLIEAVSNAFVGTVIYYSVIPGLNKAFIGDEST
jgi:hypothetical protein